MSEVRAKHDPISHSTENPKRRFKVQDVAHKRQTFAFGKEMIVIEAAKRATNEGVAKVTWSVEGSDARSEVLPDTKVTGSPGDLFVETNQATRYAGQGALARMTD